MAEVFARHMKTFYNTKLEISEEDLLAFICDYPVPCLRLELAEELDVHVLVEEVALAVGQIQVGKAPSRNGFTIALFRRLNRRIEALVHVPHIEAFERVELQT
ncbi:hypothetical protein NDU88_002948 [Pleurodeles waltl]|uniref:Uncharacterized protein n=1 Tax=Pleurodeles waltl TaxID=8319 RepID=A0AAV7MU90_PLEWA|nr:hypothetical protein NDU88_002948 [Pleurodeles waltl]